ncbi:hypothetical protein V6N12_003332 [Hibiscus sabdariffa]|uniref:Uncharacterized protein n=1 Tax=Hibiscus sabdariffa TaxID=183260 RepID=A0ABR2EBJ7_9ROSI
MDQLLSICVAEIQCKQQYSLPSLLDPLRQESVLPVSSLELVHGTLAKALFTWLLEWKAQREAGFTEQRRLPALGSGRITGRCLLGDSSWLRWLIYNWTLALFAPL